MAQYSMNTIATMMHGKLIATNEQSVIDHILTDSRKLVFPEHTLFFALAGERRDGHLFLTDLYQQGVRNFVVSHAINVADYPSANFIFVKNTLEALQLFVSGHRKKFIYPVMGITGSNGKTIVKEWLSHLLQPDFVVVRSPKSYNSQIGVPLSVWQMEDRHQLAIFEAGISEPGEMEKLERIICPTIGIFTNIGEAHSEGFVDRRQKIREKLKLFIHSQVLVYCKDYDELHEEIVAFQKTRGTSLQVFSWSRKNEAELRVKAVLQEAHGSLINLAFQNRELQLRIPFVDPASIENAVHCCCLLLYMKVDEGKILQRMRTLPVVAMRMEMKQGINRCTVINDSYSADMNSLSIALDFLLQQQQHVKRTVILSDILETGKEEHELYEQVAKSLRQKGINRLIGIGQAISRYGQVINWPGMETSFYPATETFLEQFHASQFRDESILLKGARIFQFERISKLLEQKIHQTVLEINLTAVSHNLKQYQQLLRPSTKLMAMVKAFSYGSGSFEIAGLLQFHKVDYLAVAYADEGVELRRARIRLPIMVMNAEENSFEAITTYSLQPEMYSFEILLAFDRFLKTEGILEFPIHIKLDTGMHRLGFESREIGALTDFLKGSSNLKVQSVFSHLVASEDPASDAYTQLQHDQFLDACNQLEFSLGYKFIRHIANTAAIVRHPDLQLDMVRLGIGLYGVDHTNSSKLDLREVSTLKTTIAQIKLVKAGDTVGYNRRGKMEKDSLIATIRLGYADGYPRRLGNGKGVVIIGGVRVPVVGNVCMDMTMVDISQVSGAKVGDDVIVFGKDLPVSELADWAETIPYEMMTGISQRVKRVYFEE